MRPLLVLCCIFFHLVESLQSQVPDQPSSSEIYHAIQKLNFLGSALYVAAHPDDENTRLISYLSNETKARTAYLSITRGDGGQNLIGPELRELLGVLRTQELLGARRIDGGRQFFTRANDFGYSKHPDETLALWNKEKVLADVIWTIRRFRPDIIVTRFDHRSPGTTHGHHTSSAMLAVEAFDLAAKDDSYADQLSWTSPWQPHRLFFNTSWWFYGSRENFEKADKSNLLSVDIGAYYPLLGESNNEIAAEARSQHRSQGFGSLGDRGSEEEYLELIKGTLPEDKSNLFEGIDTSWSRLTDGNAIGAILGNVEQNFNFKDPSVHLSELLDAHALIQKISDPHWREVKTDEIEKLIQAVTGLYLEASAAEPTANPGGHVQVKFEAVSRNGHGMVLQSLSLNDKKHERHNVPLARNEKIEMDMDMPIPDNTAYTSAYWLREKGSLGMYRVDEQSLIGLPETPRPFNATFAIEMDGRVIEFETPLVYRYSRPDKGELYQPFEVLPAATSRLKDKVLVFSDNAPKQIPVTVKAHTDSVSGRLRLEHPDGWQVNKSSAPFTIHAKGDEQTILFELTPPQGDSEGLIVPVLTIDGTTIDKEAVSLEYDHIPTQTVLLPSEAKVVRIDIQKSGEHIAYIAGAGDGVAESLRQIGYTVHNVDPASISAGSLDNYDAVVLGIRAYNVVEELKYKQPFLLEYVKKGGNMIVQYNTAGRWNEQFENIAPYPLVISRDRVTDENSEVRIINANHPLVNFPNAISPKDFEGWVQERGLYFPDEWSSEFTPVLSMQDKGESPKEGSLLVAPYGQGHYIYTGLSFFRELPAGVPGAFKLFANMLSIGKEAVEQPSEIKG